MKYIRHFDSQEGYEAFIDSLTEDQKVLAGGPNSVIIHAGSSKPVPPTPTGNNVIWYEVNNDEPLNIDASLFGEGITLLSNEYDESAGKYKATFSGDVTHIGDYAFEYCNSLTSINIPDGVTYISNYAFANCESLTIINIPDGVTSIGEVAFECCYALTEINIPDGVTNIGNYAFQGCYALTEINIPDGVTSIGDGTFAGCGLTEINIPDGVTSIGDYAFSNCTSLAEINIPDGVTSIGEYTFASCESLTSINIPSSVTSIGAYAFSSCTSLTEINIPDGVTSIGEYTFQSCTSLTEINIPSSVTIIGNGAFQTSPYGSCDVYYDGSSYQLKNACGGDLYNVFDNSMSIHYSVTPEPPTPGPSNTIRLHANGAGSLTVKLTDEDSSEQTLYFDSDTSLDATELVFNDNIAEIVNVDLENYETGSLTHVAIPNGVTDIQWGAFGYCQYLEYLYLPSSITTLGSYILNECWNITGIQYGGTMEQWESIDKSDEWNYNSAVQTIRCTDGDISLTD